MGTEDKKLVRFDRLKEFLPHGFCFLFPPFRPPPFPPGFFLSNAVGWKLNWWFTESKEDGEKSLGYEEKD